MSNKHHRYTPYCRPSSIDPSEQRRLRDLKVELDGFNRADCPVTYCDQTGGWIDWTRPIRIFRNGTMSQVSAQSFPRDIKPPMCPHTHKSDEDRTMKLHLQKQYSIYNKCDFFRATSHACIFTVVIPRLNAPLVTQDPAMIAERIGHENDEDAAEIQEEYSYDLDHLLGPSFSPSEAEVRNLLAFQQLSTPPSSSRAPSRLVNHLDKIYINSRVSPMRYAAATRATIQPRPLSRTTSTHAASFFEKTVADARANKDSSLISHIKLNYKNGIYRLYPLQHPASNLEDTHRILEPYDERIFPGCLNRAFEHAEYMHTDIGRVIRELNSTLGVPLAAINTIYGYSRTCPECRCAFSIDGYNTHLENQRCKNFPSPTKEITPVFIDLNDVEELCLRKFPQRPAAAPVEFIDTPIGAAFMEWNSRIGVPKDVWVLIRTAYVQCAVCRLCRTFNGDKAHRDHQGNCADAGNGVATLDKGKGKEREIGGGVEQRIDSEV
ncbi:hypothetical protein C0992_007458 [Termitomyces sp. T32_za158]|nr:hypothetical protein C0992_007458 [Termitomyces sp. T32_za158]